MTRPPAAESGTPAPGEVGRLADALVKAVHDYDDEVATLGAGPWDHDAGLRDKFAPLLNAAVEQHTLAEQKVAQRVRQALRDARRADPSTYNVWSRVSNAVDVALADPEADR